MPVGHPLLRAEPAGTRERDWVTGQVLPVAVLRTRREIVNGDVVTLGENQFYAWRDSTGVVFLVEAILEVGGRSLVVYRAPKSVAKARRLLGKTRLAADGTSIRWLLMIVRPRGRAPRSSSASNVKVTIRLTEQEHRRWSAMADGSSLGEWIRATCNERARR